LPTEIEEKVTTVIQVGGMNTLVRPDPTQDEKREWFRSVSLPSIMMMHQAWS